MTSVDLRSTKVDLGELLGLADAGPVLLVAGDGREFILAEADNFDAEVEALRNSARFQSFLDRRLQPGARIPIEEIERELQPELAQ